MECTARQTKMVFVSHDKLFARFLANPPANPNSIAQCQADLRFRLPVDYAQFLRRMNGGEGFVGRNYLRTWPVEDLIQFNKNYRVEAGAPGLFLFAQMTIFADERGRPARVATISTSSDGLKGFAMWL